MNKKITVMSAGAGGHALAADLALRGHDVTLFEHPSFSRIIDGINEAGCCITAENKISGTAKLAAAVTDPAKAFAGAEIIYFTAPSYAQKPFFDISLPYFEDGQTIVLMPGNYGSFALKNELKRLGRNVLIAETDNLPYVCASPAPGHANIRGIKKQVMLAAMPMSDYDAAEAAIKDAFPTGIARAANVIQTGISNTNMVLHCMPMLMNAGRIDGAKEGFRFYPEGMPPAMCAAMEELDKERLAVAKAFGIDAGSVADYIRKQYGVEGATLYDVIQANTVFAAPKPDSPRTLNHRFLTEDTPFGMVPAAALGDAAGVETPIMDAVNRLCGLLVGEDYTVSGQTLSNMGLSGMSADEILKHANG